MTTLQDLLVRYDYNLFKVDPDHDLKDTPYDIPRDVQKRVSVVCVPCYTIYIDEGRMAIELSIRIGAATNRLIAAKAALEFVGDPDAEETIQTPETHTIENPQITRTTVIGERTRTDKDKFGDSVGSSPISPVATSTDSTHTDTDTTSAHNVVNTTGERKTTKQKVMTPYQAYQRREAYDAEVYDVLWEALRGAIYSAQCFR